MSTLQSGQITGGTYTHNTLTLRRQIGNISIGGFPDEGAQSVSVSLSGSTLTVDVDGHSDSVNIPGLNPLKGTLDMSSWYFKMSEEKENVSFNEYFLITNAESKESLFGDCTVTGYADYTTYTYERAVSGEYYAFLTNESNISASLSGSGKIIFKEVAPYSRNSNIYSTQDTRPDLEITVSNGTITDVALSKNTLYFPNNLNSFGLCAKSVSIQY